MGNTLVRKGYDRAAKDYLKKRNQFKNIKYLDKLAKLLKTNSIILDIGCGAGKPVDKYLVAKGHQVIGIDISPKQVELAKQNIPQGKFEVKDMSDLKEKEYQVDAAVSFYAIFHIPKEQHSELFQKINSYLSVGGYLLVTMGSREWEGKEEFHGVKMFWSHYGAGKNKALITNNGFEIVFEEIDSSGGEKHQVILARKNKWTF